jgi:hypothetical protein
LFAFHGGETTSTVRYILYSLTFKRSFKIIYYKYIMALLLTQTSLKDDLIFAGILVGGVAISGFLIYEFVWKGSTGQQVTEEAKKLAKDIADTVTETGKAIVDPNTYKNGTESFGKNLKDLGDELTGKRGPADQPIKANPNPKKGDAMIEVGTGVIVGRDPAWLASHAYDPEKQKWGRRVWDSENQRWLYGDTVQDAIKNAPPVTSKPNNTPPPTPSKSTPIPNHLQCQPKCPTPQVRGSDLAATPKNPYSSGGVWDGASRTWKRRLWDGAKQQWVIV